MKVNIKIYFDEDEKLQFEDLPDGVLDDAVKYATQEGLEVIKERMTTFLNVVMLYGYLGDKGGGIS